VEESILHAELVDRLIPRESKGRDGANYRRLHNGAESLIIIDTETLCEPVKNIPIKCLVSLELVLEDPLAGDNIGAIGAQN
jgi:hypothetical protein